MSNLSFTADFEPAIRDEWLRRAAAALKAPIDGKLTTLLPGGIEVDALYDAVEGVRAERVAAGRWVVMQRMDHPEAPAANAQALDDLVNGATGLTLLGSGARSAHGFGLREISRASIARALKDIRLDAISLRLDCGPQGRAAAEALAEFIATQPIDPARLAVAFGMDPVSVLAQRGYLDEDWSERAKLVSGTVHRLLAQDFQGPFLTADGRVWHDAGASEVQELGCVLAAAVTYLRTLEFMHPDELPGTIGATLAADKDMFLTLAKFRAIRLLWARVLKACELPFAPLPLHGESSWRMMARLDPHTNILRADAAVFGAGLGGADSITVLPFSLAQGLPNGFARRVARNVQSVLLEESQLWRVHDPASGSGYVEHLTESLCERSWSFFQGIERRGGIVQALETGWLRQEIDAARQELLARKEPIIGSSIHRLPKEYEAAIEATEPRFIAYDERALMAMRLAESFGEAA